MIDTDSRLESWEEGESRKGIRYDRSTVKRENCQPSVTTLQPSDSSIVIDQILSVQGQPAGAHVKLHMGNRSMGSCPSKYRWS